MAVDLTLHSVDGQFVAFNIDTDLWFMQLEPIPRIFNADLKSQIIPNLDYWFQAKTHQRYGYQSFCDAVVAFRAGLSKSYTGDDIRAIVAKTVLLTKSALIERLGEYNKHYWIELLDQAKLETVWLPKVREKFEDLRVKLGDDGLYNYLCRMWKFSVRHHPGLVIIFERLIRRLGREPTEPKLPVTDDLDLELCKIVLALVLDSVPNHRNVPHHVQERLGILNGRR